MHVDISKVVRGEAQAWAIPIVFLIVGVAGRSVALAISGYELNTENFFQAYCRWDCSWYLGIVKDGYNPAIRADGAANWAFFPLLPLFSVMVSGLTGLSATRASTVVALLAVVCAARFGRELCTTRREYAVYCALLLCGPASLYFSIPYSESLFILFTVLMQVFLLRQQYIAAGIASAFLSASRVVGVFAAVAILISAVQRYLKGGGRLSKLPTAFWRYPDPLLGAAIAPLGIESFSLYLRYHTGDGLAFAHIHREWSRYLTNPIAAWWSSMHLVPLSFLHVPSEGQIMALACVLGLALVVWLALNKDFAMAAFCAACILLPMLTGTISMFRLVMGLAPLWLVSARVLSLWFVESCVVMPIIVGAGIWIDVLWLTNQHALV